MVGMMGGGEQGGGMNGVTGVGGSAKDIGRVTGGHEPGECGLGKM